MSENKSLLDKIPFMQKLKNIKHIELIIIAIFVVVLVIIYMSSSSSNTKNDVALNDASLEEYGDYLEEKLTKVLGKIDGIGNIDVMVTFNGRISYEYATESEEITNSSSVSGGTNTKTTINEKVIIVEQNGKDTPLIVREIYTGMRGVVVVAGGADNVKVKLDVINAISTLLCVYASKIQVLKGT